MRAVALLLAALTLAGCYDATPPALEPYVPKTYAVERNRLAMDAMKANRIEEALEFAEQAIKEDPLYYQAYLNKANMLARQGRYWGAAEILNTIIGLRPDVAQAVVFRGIFLEQAGDLREARACYARAVSIIDAQIAAGDTYPETFLNRAIALYLLRGKVSAIRELNDILEKYPGYTTARFLKERILSDDREYIMGWTAHAPDGSR
jgi:tetratricopeptide (TPR) repeat protein